MTMPSLTIQNYSPGDLAKPTEFVQHYRRKYPDAKMGYTIINQEVMLGRFV